MVDPKEDTPMADNMELDMSILTTQHWESHWVQGAEQR